MSRWSSGYLLDHELCGSGSIPEVRNLEICVLWILSTSWILADEVCTAWNVKADPGVLWYSLGTSTSAKVQEERGPYLCETIQSSGTIQKRWTGWKTWQGDDHQAVGEKSKMPHEMLLRDSESRSTGSRFWWNPEISYFQISTPGIEPGVSNG